MLTRGRNSTSVYGQTQISIAREPHMDVKISRQLGTMFCSSHSIFDFAENKNDSNKQLPQNTCIDERNTNGRTAEAKNC